MPLGTTTPSQSGPGSNGNEGVLRIPQSLSITGTSPSDCLVSYPRHTWGEESSYPSAEVQLVHSTAPAGWAKERCLMRGFNIGMIENYVLSGLFSVIYFLACGHVFSSQLFTSHFSFQLYTLGVSSHLFTQHVSIQPFTLCSSFQLSCFKLPHPAFQLVPARQKGSHSFYSRGFRSATSYSSPSVSAASH